MTNVVCSNIRYLKQETFTEGQEKTKQVRSRKAARGFNAYLRIATASAGTKISMDMDRNRSKI